MPDQDQQRTDRALGLCGLLGALVMATGDLLMLGAPVSGAQAMLAQFGLMELLPWWRVQLGGLLGPAGAVLLVGGAAFVWRLLRPGPLQAVAALGLGALAVFSAAYHAVFPLICLLLPTADVRPGAYMGMLLVIAALPGLPAALALTAAVALGRSTLPRWAALLTPTVAIPVLLGLGLLLPAPVGGPVVGAAYNLGFATFYASALRLRRA